MPQLQVDTEKLAAGLEAGIERSGLELQPLDSYSELFGEQNRLQYALRTKLCGLVSSAVDLHLEEQGISSRLYVSRPGLSFDWEMGHVVVVAGSETEDPARDEDATVLDGTYGQFLGYVGMTPEYEAVSGTSVFPAEKVLVYQQSEQSEAMDWLTEIATSFQAINTHQMNPYGRDAGRGALHRSPRRKIRQELSKIWDPTYFMPWQPGENLQTEIEIVAAHIPVGSIVT